MVRTKVFTSGNSQAIRIPKEFHIDQSEVFIKKIGATIVLYPENRKWENLQRSLTEFTEDFMAERRSQPVLPEREIF